ncbi:hypothetical protein LO762_01970 [Actinocorallia sp. API 0066]|uniref:hypothetical protein n=1 Tax=Actinocorallia sp. API 0066 TaxID=2896846 RepID=UPI001E500ED3|nr:hypothetical protein [Actinocorallia sp. API 0066]MCD0447967.1 hypothetical protein [Actinocorallia sp. API 0066]
MRNTAQSGGLDGHGAAVPVTAESQPDLWLLVQDTAARLGVAAPEAVGLHPRAEVTAAPGVLLLGLPHVLGLPADELAAVVAHELARPQAVASRPLAFHAGGRASVTEALVVSPESVASALVHASYLAFTFERFVLQYVGPLAAAGWYPVDLWDAWRAGRVQRERAARPVPLRPLPVEVEAGFAKALAEGLASAAPPEMCPVSAGCPTSQRLAAAVRREPAGLRGVTFDGVDETVWEDAAARCAVRIRGAAAEFLGHPVVLGADVVALVRQGRAADILRKAGAESPELFPVGRVLGPLLGDALRRRGYRPEHVLAQHVMVGPGFDRIDTAALIDPVEGGGEPSALLVDLLS